MTGRLDACEYALFGEEKGAKKREHSTFPQPTTKK
jgi:hypothetical protein